MPKFTKAVFRANFTEDEDVSNAAVVEEILRSLGQSKAWIERSQARRIRKVRKSKRNGL